MNSSRKESPVVRIDMTFDKIKFDGGLRLCGKVKHSVRSIKRYTISRYQDLNPLLGTDWHYRGINTNGDFCFVILETIEFYIYKKRPITEYRPGTPIQAVHKQAGYGLVFSFVKGNGTPSQFGTDTSVFVNNY